jgi:hypothetical protein
MLEVFSDAFAKADRICRRATSAPEHTIYFTSRIGHWQKIPTL